MAQQKTMRRVAEFLVVGLCTVAFALNASGIVTTLITDTYAGTRDFICYWASGHQLVQHANPYDGQAILRLEHSGGTPPGLQPLLMRNPPPALLLVLPLGFLGVRAASLLWSLLMVASLVLSVRNIAALHGRSKSKLNLLAYTFAPALCCLIAGQVAIFVLLGLVLFLRFWQTRPFLAGASLWLCALKPHLFLPFGVVLLAWIVARRCYRLLFGAVAAAGLSVAVVFVLDPPAWMQYAQAMRTEGIQTQAVPCVSAIVRLMLSPNSMWVQFLPAAIGCAWALVFFQRHREDWNWLEHGSLLMIVSVVVAPYSWGLDQTVMLPALMHALYQNRSRGLAAIFALLSAVISMANFLGVPIGSVAWYVWTAPAWLAWFLFAAHRAGLGESNGSSGIGLGVTTVSCKL